MTHAFRKQVKPRSLQRGDLVLRVLRGLVVDPRINGLGVGHMSLKIDSRGCKMVDGSKWKPSLRADQCRSIKEVLCLRLWSQDG